MLTVVLLIPFFGWAAYCFKNINRINVIAKSTKDKKLIIKHFIKIIGATAVLIIFVFSSFLINYLLTNKDN
jgi:hypothetical protein